MTEKIELITKLENGSLEIKYESGKTVNLPDGNYNDKTIQAALIFAIVNKKD